MSTLSPSVINIPPPKVFYLSVLAILKHPQLNEAYETLKDDEKRRTYNAIYSSIKKIKQETAASQNSQHDHSTSSSVGETQSHKAAIKTLQRNKTERTERWSKTRKIYNDAIFELNRDIRNIQSAFSSLEDVEKAILKEEADKKSWTTWLISPLYSKRVDTQEEKEQKERERIERLHTKHFKQRKLQAKQSELKGYEDLQREKLRELEIANRKDEMSISALQELIRAQQIREQREKERLEREAQEKTWREWRAEQVKDQARQKEERRRQETKAREAQAKRAKELEDERRRQQMREQLARDNEIKRYEEVVKREALYAKKAAEFAESRRRARADQSTRVANCSHDGWWNKVIVHSACDTCSTSGFGYLLECPTCHMKACASCQSILLPPLKRGRRGKTQRHIPRTPSPPSDYEYYD